LLSVPTREYFQSSPFVPESTEDPHLSGISSVRSSSAAYSGWSAILPSEENTADEFWDEDRKRRWVQGVASPSSSGRRTEDEEELDETEAEDTFVAGMIFALSRRILPGITYSPYRPPPAVRPHGHRNLSPLDIPPNPNTPLYEGRWRLDECLRFATEMAGRRMRRRNTAGLALTMEKVGWRM